MAVTYVIDPLLSFTPDSIERHMMTPGLAAVKKVQSIIDISPANHTCVCTLVDRSAAAAANSPLAGSFGPGSRTCLKIQTSRRGDYGLLKLESDMMKFLNGFRHPNILCIIDEYHLPPYQGIHMELCDRGDLSSDGTRYPPHEKMRFIAEAATGLAFLHSKDIMHADIKPHNIGLKECNGNVVAKLIDFGLSGTIPKHITMGHPFATRLYRPPETMIDQPYPPEVIEIRGAFDVWCLGVTLIAIFTERCCVPWNVANVCDPGYKRFTDELRARPIGCKNLFASLPIQGTPEYVRAHLIPNMLRGVEARRWTAEQVRYFIARHNQ